VANQKTAGVRRIKEATLMMEIEMMAAWVVMVMVMVMVASVVVVVVVERKVFLDGVILAEEAATKVMAGRMIALKVMTSYPLQQ